MVGDFVKVNRTIIIKGNILQIELDVFMVSQSCDTEQQTWRPPSWSPPSLVTDPGYKILDNFCVEDANMY